MLVQLSSEGCQQC